MDGDKSSKRICFQKGAKCLLNQRTESPALRSLLQCAQPTVLIFALEILLKTFSRLILNDLRWRLVQGTQAATLYNPVPGDPQFKFAVYYHLFALHEFHSIPFDDPSVP